MGDCFELVCGCFCFDVVKTFEQIWLLIETFNSTEILSCMESHKQLCFNPKITKGKKLKKTPNAFKQKRFNN